MYGLKTACCLQTLCSVSSFAGFEKRGFLSCEFPLCLVLFLHFDCRFQGAKIPKLLIILCDDRFLSIVSYHMINLNFYKTQDGTKQFWGDAQVTHRPIRFTCPCNKFVKVLLSTHGGLGLEKISQSINQPRLLLFCLVRYHLLNLRLY